MKKILAIVALAAVCRALTAQELSSKEVLPGIGADQVEKALSIMKPTEALACSARGSTALGAVINGALGAGSCTSFDPTNGTLYADFYTFTATAGHTVRVSTTSSLTYLSTIQDVVTSNVLASSGTCGLIQNSCSFTYTIPVSGTYYLGIGAYQTGAYTLSVTDITTGSPNCTASSTNLCLNSGRFRVSVTYSTPTSSGAGTAVGLTSDTGYFWFFSSGNVEMVIKVVDGRALNNHFWVFAGGLTNVDVTISVVDTQTGTIRTYRNPQNTPFQPIQDTAAF